MSDADKVGFRCERGATIIVVAITLVALVAMAALAIDIASLYVARGEAQRAADAAALAGAKMFVTSGITSLVGISSPPVMQSDVCQDGNGTTAAASNLQAEAAISQNSIGGQPAVIQSITCDFSRPENPRITVKVQPVTLPTFFAKIWGGTASTVSATAMAEAYNASGSDVPPTPPLQLISVKPWLVPNCDPANSTGPCTPGYFVNPAGTLTGNNFIGQTVQLNRVANDEGATGGNSGALTFYPLNFTASSNLVCPSAGAPSCSGVTTVNNYLDNIACSSSVAFQCGQKIGRNQSIRVQTAGLIDTQTVTGASCMIHEGSDGSGQDSFSTTAVPVTITGGTNNLNSNLQSISNISRSDSVITVPLYDGSPLCTAGRFGATCNATTQVIGFLQLGIMQANSSGTPQLNAVILNAVGCTSSAINSFSSNPTPTNGISSNSAIPVRLVRNP